jgi:hypothetical protein
MTEPPAARPPLAGGCQCGAICYEISGQPLEVYVCHCRECRKQSASVFGISVWVNRSDFTLLTGTPRFWSRPADSGRVVDCAFCPECGSRVWHEPGGGVQRRAIVIKGGSLDEPVDVGSAMHVWVSRKLPGVVIPEGVTQYPENPV